jgi:endogenous inhibitor of DNA gyrase (YacG/DUF329 family)
MRTLSNSDILSLWEKGRRLHPLDRGLLALSVAAALPDENVADWPVGRRNRMLFEMHCQCFGSSLQGWTACPECGEKVEFDIDARSLVPLDSPQSQETIAVGDCCFRLPTSRDLARFTNAVDIQAAAISLAQRCLVNGPEPAAWTERVLVEIGDNITAVDSMAETRLALDCPQCGHQWEVESRARRLLWEVHMLASAYGWSERETLTVSADRRAIYLEMVQA